MAYKLNGKTLQADRGFTHDGVQYPRNWLVKSTEAERTAIGITWEADPVRVDDRFYWNGNPDAPKALDTVYHVWTQDEANQHLLPEGKSVGDPKLDENNNQLISYGLKHTMTAEVKDTAGKLLAQTDWYITRKVERNVDIPTDVASKRAAIVAESDRLETAIAGASTVEALLEVMNSQDWGE